MDSQDAKAIGCNRILQLSKEKTEFFFASRSRSAVTTAGCSIFLVFCTLTIFKKLGGGTQMWIFMKKAQQRSSFSWSRREVYMMIWLWYDVCIYIYIYYNIYYITYHMMFQSFWPSNTGVVLVVTVMSIAVALIPLPAALLWVRASTKNTPLKGCFVKTSVFWLTNLFELFDVGVILIWWFD